MHRTNRPIPQPALTVANLHLAVVKRRSRGRHRRPRLTHDRQALGGVPLYLLRRHGHPHTRLRWLHVHLEDRDNHHHKSDDNDENKRRRDDEQKQEEEGMSAILLTRTTVH